MRSVREILLRFHHLWVTDSIFKRERERWIRCIERDMRQVAQHAYHEGSKVADCEQVHELVAASRNLYAALCDTEFKDLFPPHITGDQIWGTEPCKRLLKALKPFNDMEV